MEGYISSDERCSICGGKLVDNARNAVWCPTHNQVHATRFIVRFGREIFRRFKIYDEAAYFLSGIRFKKYEGSFDSRDYKQSLPLGIDKQLDKYLEIKQKTLKEGSLKNLKPNIKRIQNHFQNVSVKQITYADIEDFIHAQEGIGDKTKSNLLSTLHDFYTWLVKRREIRKDQMPEFPRVAFQLGFRKTISKETQWAILEEVKRITSKNPRIYLGIFWASTYINTRPDELRNILEEDIDYERGLIFIKDHKTSRSVMTIKTIPLLPEDLELIKMLPRGFPKMPFFRRDTGGGGQPAGKKFGKNLFYDTWMQACKNLGIEGVDLYAGTRHTSAEALRQYLSPEGVKRITGHQTNEAFERYFMRTVEEMRDGFALTRCSTTDLPEAHPTTQISNRKNN